MALVPEDAVLIKNGQKTTIPVAQLRPGDIIEIAPGGRLPTDAVLVSGFASFDESALTGESVPVERNVGERWQQAAYLLIEPFKCRWYQSKVKMRLTAFYS